GSGEHTHCVRGERQFQLPQLDQEVGLRPGTGLQRFRIAPQYGIGLCLRAGNEAVALLPFKLVLDQLKVSTGRRRSLILHPNRASREHGRSEQVDRGPTWKVPVPDGCWRSLPLLQNAAGGQEDLLHIRCHIAANVRERTGDGAAETEGAQCLEVWRDAAVAAQRIGQVPPYPWCPGFDRRLCGSKLTWIGPAIHSCADLQEASLHAFKRKIGVADVSA